MTRQNKRRARDQALGGTHTNTMRDTLLALDRAVVELSMHIYNLPAQDRFVMREQNQRRHDAVREHLPRRAQFSCPSSTLPDHTEQTASAGGTCTAARSVKPPLLPGQQENRILRRRFAV
jgi:hypothetical protein